MTAARTGAIYWEDDPLRTRRVRGICRVCQRFMSREYGMEISVGNAGIVSPSGIAHAQHDFRHEETACGKDATGSDWWWRT